MASVHLAPAPFAQSPGPWARVLALVAGLWLFASGLLWPAASGPRLSPMVVGLLLVATALWALWVDLLRFATSALAVWLLFSAFFTHRWGSPALVSDLVVALVVFALSLVPADAPWRRPPQRLGPP